jgi:hypothetical protein
MTKEHLNLKWGTVKGWSDLSDKSVELLQEYFKEGYPLGCATDKPDAERKEVLCKLIEQLDGTIYNDWEDKEMTKEEAKQYILTY